MNRIFAVIIALMMPWVVCAQVDDSQIESLREKCAEFYRSGDVDSAIELGTEILDGHSERLDIANRCFILDILSQCYCDKENFDRAIDYDLQLLFILLDNKKVLLDGMVGDIVARYLRFPHVPDLYKQDLSKAIYNCLDFSSISNNRKDHFLYIFDRAKIDGNYDMLTEFIDHAVRLIQLCCENDIDLSACLSHVPLAPILNPEDIRLYVDNLLSLEMLIFGSQTNTRSLIKNQEVLISTGVYEFNCNIEDALYHIDDIIYSKIEELYDDEQYDEVINYRKAIIDNISNISPEKATRMWEYVVNSVYRMGNLEYLDEISQYIDNSDLLDMMSYQANYFNDVLSNILSELEDTYRIIETEQPAWVINGEPDFTDATWRKFYAQYSMLYYTMLRLVHLYPNQKQGTIDAVSGLQRLIYNDHLMDITITDLIDDVALRSRIMFELGEYSTALDMATIAYDMYVREGVLCDKPMSSYSMYSMAMAADVLDYYGLYDRATDLLSAAMASLQQIEEITVFDVLAFGKIADIWLKLPNSDAEKLSGLIQNSDRFNDSRFDVDGLPASISINSALCRYYYAVEDYESSEYYADLTCKSIVGKYTAQEARLRAEMISIRGLCRIRLGRYGDGVADIAYGLNYSHSLVAECRKELMHLYMRYKEEISLFNWENAEFNFALYLMKVIKDQKDLCLLPSTDRERAWNIRYWEVTDVINFYLSFVDMIDYGRLDMWSQFDYDDKIPAVNAIYDWLLYSKGLLLRTDVTIDAILRDNENEDVRKMYSRYKWLNNELLALSSDRVEYATTLARLQMEESNLMTAIRNNDIDIDVDRTCTSLDIKSVLRDHEVAIEFLYMPANDSRSDGRYYALVLRNEGIDKLVRVCTDSELKSYLQGGTTQAYNSAELSNLIWSDILQRASIEEGDTIYFSPDGFLYQFAVEYLPTDDGRIMSEKYDIRRLSSTNEIYFRDTDNDRPTSVLYGGLKYDLDNADISDNSLYFNSGATIRSNAMVRDIISANTRDFDFRASHVAELPGTLDEVNSIAELLRDNRIANRLFVGKEGTETSFKSLSGRAPKWLLIATHGFFMSPTKAEIDSRKFAGERTVFDDRRFGGQIDYSMNRAGLLFAGASAALKGEQISEQVDDGVLTALEISQLDLRGTDLVVLSACQTAMGDITSDGVAGLQRGFKKAGVQTIVMSLWKVSDNATSILMKRFYENLTSDRFAAKRDAFNDAVMYLRNYEDRIAVEYDDLSREQVYDPIMKHYVYPKKTVYEYRKIYSDPYYWAAFIMLD